VTDKPESVDAYMAALPEPARTAAERLRALIHAAAPVAAEAIRYGMPAFQADGRTFIHLGAWKRHVAVYPVYPGDAAFEARVGPYRTGKDTVRFPLNKALPEDVVTLVVEAQRRASLP
jgi:uncharacterized protein YdhG (YjbR/CyaY superfamily)